MNVTYWDKFLVIRTTEQVLLTWMCTETIAAGIQTESDEPFRLFGGMRVAIFRRTSPASICQMSGLLPLERLSVLERHSIEFIIPYGWMDVLHTCHLMWRG